MLLNFLIWYNKRKLDKMITSDYSYDEILKQSQKLDVLINIWMKNYLRFRKRAWLISSSFKLNILMQFLMQHHKKIIKFNKK